MPTLLDAMKLERQKKESQSKTWTFKPEQDDKGFLETAGNIIRTAPDNIAYGFGNAAETAVNELESLMRPKNMSPTEWHEEFNKRNSGDLAAIRNWGRDVQERNAHYYDDPLSAEAIAASIFQSAPESLGTMALSGLLGSAVGGPVGTIGGALVGGAKKLTEGYKWANRLRDAYNAENRLGKAARALTPSGRTLSTVGIGTELESRSEGRHAADNYIREAKANGTYVPNQTELEAEELAEKVRSGNRAAISGTNAVQYGLTFSPVFKNTGKLGTVARLLGTMGTEAAEEMIQEIIPRSVRGKNWNVTDDEVLAAGLTGAIMGAGFHGAGRAADYVSDYVLNRNRNQTPTPIEQITTSPSVTSTPTTNVTGKIAQDTAGMLNNIAWRQQLLLAQAQQNLKDKYTPKATTSESVPEMPKAQTVSSTSQSQIKNSTQGNIFGVESYNMPTQSDRITQQVSKLKDGWQQVIPQIGGVLKNKFGINATISSAARTAEHNAAVGGVPTSHHIIRENGGDALDIVFDRGTSRAEQDKIADYFKNSGLFKEVLYHDVGSGAHLHLGGLQTDKISKSQTSQQNKTLTADDPNFSEKENKLWRYAQKMSDYLYSKTNLRISPEMFYRQWSYESENGTSELARKDHNYGGLTYYKVPTKEELLAYDPSLKNDADFMARGIEVFRQPEKGANGYYRHYKSDEDYFKSYIDDFIIPRIKRGEITADNVKSVESYATAMKNSGYFGGELSNYISGMNSKKNSNYTRLFRKRHCRQ